ncbi:hypothetical protein BDR26DRAFT_724523 [Obelidium mucronatum]|nr:hypothetical protein BDR26DRAFT_724523 [Obelidium mucronatum]
MEDQPVGAPSSPSFLGDCLWQKPNDEICRLKFTNPEVFYKHLLEEHVGRKSNSRYPLSLNCRWTGCSHAKKPFSKRDHIASHCRAHVNYKAYVCGDCNSPFKWPHDLKKHCIANNHSLPNEGSSSGTSSGVSSSKASPRMRGLRESERSRTAKKRSLRKASTNSLSVKSEDSPSVESSTPTSSQSTTPMPSNQEATDPEVLKINQVMAGTGGAFDFELDSTSVGNLDSTLGFVNQGSSVVDSMFSQSFGSDFVSQMNQPFASPLPPPVTSFIQTPLHMNFPQDNHNISSSFLLPMSSQVGTTPNFNVDLNSFSQYTPNFSHQSPALGLPSIQHTQSLPIALMNQQLSTPTFSPVQNAAAVTAIDQQSSNYRYFLEARKIQLRIMRHRSENGMDSSSSPSFMNLLPSSSTMVMSPTQGLPQSNNLRMTFPNQFMTANQFPPPSSLPTFASSSQSLLVKPQIPLSQREQQMQDTWFGGGMTQDPSNL